ncbi:cobalamin biosynthesis protein CobG [Sphingobium sp.]|uniref:cobalamin biosynthesis protein CobG n=1 Tax=Sphingobium sp. TaxID=1912891 RepID=UPI0035C6AD8A
MEAGDGLLIRVRPPLGRLTAMQAAALADAARQHGNGLIDLTNRAALQIRGVAAQGYTVLVERLVALGLTDADPAREARSAVILTPDWQPGDDSHRIAEALLERLDDLPDLPPKIGVAIDTGPAPALQQAPADFRFERGECGAIILRAEGRALGVPVAIDDAAQALIALTRWFVDSGGPAAGRMARHQAPLPSEPAAAPAAARPLQNVLAQAPGAFYGAPFGQIEADEIAAIASQPGIVALRLTPWRGLILEGCIEASGLAAFDPLLRADACTGAPACPQAGVATRDLAARLAPFIRGSLHVSGCAKGCARPSPAEIVLTGRDGRFDLARNARAGSPPEHTALTPSQILALFGAS